jgi:hypothetical protein
MGEKRNAYRILVGNPEGKRPLSWWIILKFILKEIGWGGMDWIDVVQDRDQCSILVNTVMNLWVP